MAIDKPGNNLFVTDQYKGVFPISVATQGSSVTLGASNVVPTTTTGGRYVALDPTASELLTSDNDSISAFSFNANVTVVSSRRSDPATGFLSFGEPGGLCVDSAGANVYVADPGLGRIWQLPLVGGQLLPPASSAIGAAALSTNPSIYNAFKGANDVVLTPAGDFLVAGNTDGTVEVFPITAGALGSSRGGHPASARLHANVTALAFDPTGGYLVTANGGADDVTLFQFSSGNVVYAGTNVVIPGSGPNSVLFHPNGNVVYVANTASLPATISAFTFGPSGLAPLPGSPFPLPATAAGPTGLAIK
jgi:DNA-binding beta-propeller fold protein YncE